MQKPEKLSLPDELIVKILKNLSLSTLMAVVRTKPLSAVAKEASIWRKRFQQHFPDDYSWAVTQIKEGLYNWYNLFHAYANYTYRNISPLELKRLLAIKERDFPAFLSTVTLTQKSIEPFDNPVFWWDSSILHDIKYNDAELLLRYMQELQRVHCYHMLVSKDYRLLKAAVPYPTAFAKLLDVLGFQNNPLMIDMGLLKKAASYPESLAALIQRYKDQGDEQVLSQIFEQIFVLHYTEGNPESLSQLLPFFNNSQAIQAQLNPRNHQTPMLCFAATHGVDSLTSFQNRLPEPFFRDCLMARDKNGFSTLHYSLGSAETLRYVLSILCDKEAGWSALFKQNAPRRLAQLCRTIFPLLSSKDRGVFLENTRRFYRDEQTFIRVLTSQNFLSYCFSELEALKFVLSTCCNNDKAECKKIFLEHDSLFFKAIVSPDTLCLILSYLTPEDLVFILEKSPNNFSNLVKTLVSKHTPFCSVFILLNHLPERKLPDMLLNADCRHMDLLNLLAVLDHSSPAFRKLFLDNKPVAGGASLLQSLIRYPYLLPRFLRHYEINEKFFKLIEDRSINNNRTSLLGMARTYPLSLEQLLACYPKDRCFYIIKAKRMEEYALFDSGLRRVINKFLPPPAPLNYSFFCNLFLGLAVFGAAMLLVGLLVFNPASALALSLVIPGTATLAVAALGGASLYMHRLFPPKPERYAYEPPAAEVPALA